MGCGMGVVGKGDSALVGRLRGRREGVTFLMGSRVAAHAAAGAAAAAGRAMAGGGRGRFLASGRARGRVDWAANGLLLTFYREPLSSCFFRGVQRFGWVVCRARTGRAGAQSLGTGFGRRIGPFLRVNCDTACCAAASAVTISTQTCR